MSRHQELPSVVVMAAAQILADAIAKGHERTARMREERGLPALGKPESLWDQFPQVKEAYLHAAGQLAVDLYFHVQAAWLRKIGLEPAKAIDRPKVDSARPNPNA